MENTIELRKMAHENGLKNVDGSREMLIAALKTVSVLCYQSRSNILNDNFVVRRESYRSARQLLERQLLDCRLPT